MVTMFNVLIVNDWHAIAQVYTYASWNAEPYIVYPFFIAANLICVNVMLNCLVAFFVGAFVTKLEGEEQGGKTTEFKIDSSTRSLRRIKSYSMFSERSNSTPPSEFVDFDVYERSTYDKIMRTVSGSAAEGDAYAKDICQKLELFEALSPVTSPKRGFMTCCQFSMNRFGNRRFQTLLSKHMDVHDIHDFVSGVHSELLMREEGFVVRILESPNGEKLTVQASLIRQKPPVSLLVAA
jgi:hypothetical protein